MTTNKTFLILLLTGISYTAYNAVAVSENFAISTTIDHEITLGSFRTSGTDAGLNTTGDIDMGTITLNPAGKVYTFWNYDYLGRYRYRAGNMIVAADNITVGMFTANIDNPEACNTDTSDCGGLSITAIDGRIFHNFFGGDGNNCAFYFRYSGHGNIFTVFPYVCTIATNVSSITPGKKQRTITINYTSG